MPTEELKQALRAANVRNVEKDLAEVIAKMFDAPLPLVYRVLYAVQVADLDMRIDAMVLPEDLRKAIAKQVHAAERRVHMRGQVERNGIGTVAMKTLVPENDIARICSGCPLSLECVSESLSTPAACWKGIGKAPRAVHVRPVKIDHDKVTVESTQPVGTFVLDLKDFEI